MKDSLEDEAIRLPFLRGKIQTLQGRCCLESGQTKQAHHYLCEAIKSLGYSFPRSVIATKFKAVTSLGYQRMMLTCLRSCTVGTAEGYTADYTDQLSSCLAQLFKLFKVHGSSEA